MGLFQTHMCESVQCILDLTYLLIYLWLCASLAFEICFLIIESGSVFTREPEMKICFIFLSGRFCYVFKSITMPSFIRVNFSLQPTNFNAGYGFVCEVCALGSLFACPPANALVIWPNMISRLPLWNIKMG